ncbi:protein of unknown function [Candidatus Nitrosocosmicus franklandus]|uniref:Uncharacterized protein n=1 Tax=Candidatus Nitrosocosmicus franklandianus TaxID=1798806 RepID=A0A484IBF1_9ARCH|nr:protein of unknown function [Candidatus Nitrosocosmicus franklandus]
MVNKSDNSIKNGFYLHQDKNRHGRQYMKNVDLGCNRFANSKPVRAKLQDII